MKPIKKNKLGIYNQKELEYIEYNIFNVKYHLIDESFTFNSSDLFNTEYLEKLHIFLFNDIYNNEYCKIRNNEQLIELENKLLKEIKEMLLYNDIEYLSDKIFKLWEYQLFYDGNTRTILCYLKVLSKYYNFNITYDFNKDINEDYFIDKVIDIIKVKKYI